ncbi:DNA primase [Pararhodobacter zhoushanensis]|uniref:DNA primase n=1 Tax=Pararhodobacter zhoushanensis TaxID=2479545 RepID=A0ABT3H2Y1_9RHOB|nr:DNA primase [Pararhodobacter zhoushanensis]MCW1934190.1 DNA primase [Pararhodobacter zhoushanensis]
MSLPPGFLDELRNRVSIAQVVGRAVTWDLRKSNQGKGDFWAPCPFHHEKNASFHVDDRKGFYYCFGCQAKGDALTFLQETQNLSFMESVEALAREAGLPMPERDPGAQARDDKRGSLVEVMEKAVRFYRMQLMGSQAAEARAYLDRRGLSEAQRERWEIGFAPDQRQVLFHHLTQSGVKPEAIIEAGLCAKPGDGGAPFDRFRGRIMFPIRDARGRAIAFGGRAMAENARAKYLNSPETPLFDKGRNLFNMGPARAAAGKTGPLIVAEGYMDVIALVGAGFESAVAPLGTAVTEDQLRLIWRLHDEPIIALDGDAAGLRAGLRVANLALPLISAGQSLRFALLPGGQDPDDLIKSGGPGAMKAVIDKAVPMAKLLWEAEIQGHIFDSPERRAALDQRLRALLARITDAHLREHYSEEFRQQRRTLFADKAGPFQPGFRQPYGSGGYGKGKGKAPPGLPLPGTRGSVLAGGNEGADEELREALILAVLFAHPALLVEFDDRLVELDFRRDEHRALQTILLRAAQEEPQPDADTLAARAGTTLSDLRAQPHVSIAPMLRSQAEPDFVRRCLAEDFQILRSRRALRRELAELTADVDRIADETLTYRLGDASARMDRAGRGDLGESATDLGEDRASLSAQLQSMLDSQIWLKKKRRDGPT